MIRLERRVDQPKWLSFAVPVGSLIAALLAGSLLIAFSGNDIWGTYQRIVERAFTDDGALSSSILAATPLLFTGLAAAAAFRMGVFNIGGEGQFVMGAIAASGVGLATGESLGAGAIPLMILAGVAAGAAWAAVVGALKAFFNTNEIIVSLMLNYIASNVAYYLIFNSESYWRLLTPSGRQFPQGRPIDPSAEWTFTHIGPIDFPFGFWVGVVVAAVTFVLYRNTRYGFEVKVISDAPAAAKYAGMRTRRKVIAVMALSGALAGLGGASDVGDIRHLLDPKGLRQAGYGYTGILIAFAARFSPAGVVPVAILVGGIAASGSLLQRRLGLPDAAVTVLLGFAFVALIGCETLRGRNFAFFKGGARG